ncbi:MAG: hypothetical protein ACK4LB_11530 [Spirosomataceae bacterium]
MFLWKNIQVGLRLILTAVLMACLSGSALLTCWESGVQEETCSCEKIETEDAHEVKFDPVIELDPTNLSKGLMMSSPVWLLDVHEPIHPAFQTFPLGSPLGLNYPPPEA